MGLNGKQMPQSSLVQTLLWFMAISIPQTPAGTWPWLGMGCADSSLLALRTERWSLVPIKGAGSRRGCEAGDPFLVSFESVRFNRQLSNLVSRDGWLWCRGKSPGLWDQKNQGLKLGSFPGFGNHRSSVESLWPSASSSGRIIRNNSVY